MSTEQPSEYRRQRKSTESEPLAGMSERERQIFRFGAFDEQRYKYLGLKPGITADDVNPNWRSEALPLLFAASAIDSSIHARKGDRVRRIAEVIASMVISADFGPPEVALNDETGNLHVYAGEFWYLGGAEREELFKLFEATTNDREFPHLPNVLDGIDEGLDLIDDIVVALGSIQDQSTINDLKEATIQAIVERKGFVASPSYQEALRVLLTSDRFSRRRTLTPVRSAEACALYTERHKRIRAAAKDYTIYKRRHPAKWLKYVVRDDKERRGIPKIPTEFLSQLPFKPEREIALEWTAAEMNRRHAKLAATANTIRTLLKRAKAVINAGPNVH